VLAKFRSGTLSRGSISRAEDFIFTRRRLFVCGYGLLGAWASAFALRFYTGSWVFDKAGHPTFIDFINWWVAGRFALARNALGAYNFFTFSAAQALLAKSTPPISYYYWVYPPSLLLLVAPLALLSYGTAFLAWTAATLCLYEIALYEILPFSLSVVLALLPLPVINNVFDGQTAFLMAGLVGLSLVFMNRRPYVSGICLGLLTYKPQYLLFFALALVITGQWRVIAAAAASASLFAGAAVIAFGFNAWELFLRSLQQHNPGRERRRSRYCVDLSSSHCPIHDCRRVPDLVTSSTLLIESGGLLHRRLDRDPLYADL
jgi:arabinofuranan 3-O-arabinosyltransferase